MDGTTGAMLGHSDGMSRTFTADCYKLEPLLGGMEGIYIRGEESERMYVVSMVYGNVLICAALPGSVLARKLAENTWSTFCYLLFVELAVVFLLCYLVKKKVITGIHGILESLSAITGGNLDTTVAVGGNREFEELSNGINTMVRSIVSSSNRISAIIEISGIPLAAFEYQRGKKMYSLHQGFGSLWKFQIRRRLCSVEIPAFLTDISIRLRRNP